jgi:anthranilate phosphoribosyltransferase
VGKRELHETMAAVLSRLGTEHAVVVHGTDGLGELSLAAPTEVIEVLGDKLMRLTWRPEDFGLGRGSLDSMKVAGAEDSAAIIRRILAGEQGPPRDIAVINAAAAIWTAGKSPSLVECARIAAAAIDCHAAQTLLARWVELSQSQ